MSRPLCAILLSFLLAAPGPAWAQQQVSGAGQSWAQRKCAFYAKAWQELLALSKDKGVTEDFIRGNEAFIAAGCSNGADICSTSPADIELANQLTLAAMNFGTASTFLPFVCRQ